MGALLRVVLVAGLGVAAVTMAFDAAGTPDEALRCCGAGEAARAPEALRAGVACSVFLAAAAVLLGIGLAQPARRWVRFTLCVSLALSLASYSWYSLVWLGMTL